MRLLIRWAKPKPILSWVSPGFTGMPRWSTLANLKEATAVRFTYETDAAFAKADVYEYLGERGFLCRSYGG